MVRFISAHRERWGVEPICRVLQVAPSTYYAAVNRPLSVRRQCDEHLKVEIGRVHRDNFGVYGIEKIWRQLNREGTNVGRDRVAGRRSMRSTCTPTSLPTDSSSSQPETLPGFDGSTSDRARLNPGTMARRCSSRLLTTPGALAATTVRLAPGRARFVTRPLWTGTVPLIPTMGIVVVARIAAD